MGRKILIRSPASAGLFRAPAPSRINRSPPEPRAFLLLRSLPCLTCLFGPAGTPLCTSHQKLRTDVAVGSARGISESAGGRSLIEQAAEADLLKNDPVNSWQTRHLNRFRSEADID